MPFHAELDLHLTTETEYQGQSQLDGHDDISEPLTCFLRRWEYFLDFGDPRLVPIVDAAKGTKNDGFDDKRSAMLIDWDYRWLMAMACERRGLPEWAKRIRESQETLAIELSYVFPVTPAFELLQFSNKDEGLLDSGFRLIQNMISLRSANAECSHLPTTTEQSADVKGANG